MPFTKKTQPKSLSAELGIGDERADEIIEAAHALVHASNRNDANLKNLNDTFNDNELLFAVYAYGRLVEKHTDEDDEEGKIEKAMKELGDFLQGFGVSTNNGKMN